MALRNTNTWSAKDGLGDNRAGIACPNFTTPLIVADLNSLANEYPERNSRGDRVREPACGEFSLTGDPSFEFSWDQLSGHALLLKDKKPENSHQWAMVKPSLRNGLNLVYEAAGGIDLKSAYRSPDRNREIKGAKPSDAHIWGVGADMKPAGYPTGNMKEADWNRLEDLVLSRAVGAVWTETPYSSSPDHVHASFEWWPGRPEYAQKHP